MFCETCGQTWRVCTTDRYLANIQHLLGEETVHNSTFKKTQTRTCTTRKYNKRCVQILDETKPSNTEYPSNTSCPPLRLAASKRLMQLHQCARRQDMQQQARCFQICTPIRHGIKKQSSNGNAGSTNVLFDYISMTDRSPNPIDDLMHALFALSPEQSWNSGTDDWRTRSYRLRQPSTCRVRLRHGDKLCV